MYECLRAWTTSTLLLGLGPARRTQIWYTCLYLLSEERNGIGRLPVGLSNTTWIFITRQLLNVPLNPIFNSLIDFSYYSGTCGLVLLNSQLISTQKSSRIDDESWRVEAKWTKWFRDNKVHKILNNITLRICVFVHRGIEGNRSAVQMTGRTKDIGPILFDYWLGRCFVCSLFRLQ